MQENNVSDLEAIELSIEQAKKKVALADAFERLKKNRDFKKIIEEGYLEKHAINQVHLKADARTQDERTQTYIDNSIMAISVLKQYFLNIWMEGEGARQALQVNEQTREEILDEMAQEAN